MDILELKENLIKYFNCENSIDLILNKIEIYKKFLQFENEKYNLTRLDSNEKIYLEYFLQSIIAYKNIDFTKINTVLDVGSGSGIPGIVLKIIFPHISLTIIEGNAKKVNFITSLIEKLDLTNTKAIHGRAEELIVKYRETFDLVTARAVANLETLIELLVPYAKINGLIVLPKSNNYLSEIYDMNKMLNILDCILIKIDSFNFFDYQHNVVIIKKIQKTSLKYPRIWSQICKGFNYGK